MVIVYHICPQYAIITSKKQDKYHKKSCQNNWQDFYVSILFFHDFQNFHGASLYADTAGNALRRRTLSRGNHDLHGAGFHTLTAGGAKLLIDHVHTGLGILGDSASLTDLHALTTLDAGHRLCTGTLGNYLNAAKVLIKLLKKCIGASADTFQAGHTFNVLFHRKLLHKKGNPLFYFISIHIIQDMVQNSNDNFKQFENYVGNTAAFAE